ncbi:hypothetical protein [Promicromonospora sukumoe]
MTVDEWHPDMRRDVLPGPSAQLWGQVWRGAAVAWVPLLVVTLFAAVRAEDEGTPVYLFVSFAVWLVCATLVGGRGLAPLTWLEGRRQRIEAAAGYTTSLGDDIADEALVELDVVDPRSGRVIRLAGEQMPRAFFNDRQAFMRDRLRRVRAAAQQAADTAR